MFWPQSAFLLTTLFPQQSETIPPLQNYIRLVFVVAHECVHCAVRPVTMTAGMEMSGWHPSSWTCRVSKVVHETGNLAWRNMKRGLHLVFETPYVDDFITKLCVYLFVYLDI